MILLFGSIASNRDETGIRVSARRTIEKGSVLKGRRDSSLKHAETGNLLNNGRRLFIRSGNAVTPQVSLDRS